jgi:hypothetical protein
VSDSPNVSVVRRLYQARGNPDVIRQVLAREVRWEVVDGFPYGAVYEGLDRVLRDFLVASSPTLMTSSQTAPSFSSPAAVLARGACRAPRLPRPPAGAPRSQEEHGAARLWLVLDRHRRWGRGGPLGLLGRLGAAHRGVGQPSRGSRRRRVDSLHVEPPMLERRRN